MPSVVQLKFPTKGLFCFINKSKTDRTTCSIEENVRSTMRVCLGSQYFHPILKTLKSRAFITAQIKQKLEWVNVSTKSFHACAVECPKNISHCHQVITICIQHYATSSDRKSEPVKNWSYHWKEIGICHRSHQLARHVWCIPVSQIGKLLLPVTVRCPAWLYEAQKNNYFLSFTRVATEICSHPCSHCILAQYGLALNKY